MENIWLSLILSTALAALAVWRRALTPAATATAWCLAVVITWCGGPVCFAALAATFLFTIAAGKLSGKGREKIEKKLHAKTGKRDAVQILCNVLVAAVMALGWALTEWRGFLLACGAALAESLADSLASELGVMSKGQPRDICTGKRVEKGLSGGVTPLGLGASLLGAVLIAAVCLPLGLGGRGFGLMAACGFLGALLDSVMGSRLQAKYRCPVCGTLSERKTHCDVPGTLERGAAWVNNDVVNVLNNAIAAGLALLLAAL
ncbi:MAG: DUF92 domain-containing protein [Oscillospiraceae bacterium]